MLHSSSVGFGISAWRWMDEEMDGMGAEGPVSGHFVGTRRTHLRADDAPRARWASLSLEALGGKKDTAMLLRLNGNMRAEPAPVRGWGVMLTVSPRCPG